MAGNQLPVLTLDFDDEKIKKLQEISDKFKEAFAIAPGGKPLPGGSHTPSVPSTWGDKGNKRVPETQFDKFLKGLNKDAQGTLKTFGLINKTLQTTTSRLKGLFQTTISWGVKIAAIGGGGGMFGYGYMTNHVAQQYRSSQGLGVTTGQMQAASAVYGTRISNTGNIMQALANAQDNPGDPNYSALMALNINPRDGAAANMPKLFERVTSLLKQYKDTGVSQSILKAYRLDGMIDVATANQILANSDRFPQLNQQFAEQSQKLDSAMGSGTQQKYQDLSARFAINANRIGNSFIKALARLSGPIGRISDNLTASIERFLNGRNGQALFDTLASGLEKLGKWLGSDDFQTDLKTFAICVKKIITAIGDVISWIAGNVPGVKIPRSIEEAKKDSYFLKRYPATETTPDVPAVSGDDENDPSWWGLAKATGKTIGGIGRVIGKSIFPGSSKYKTDLENKNISEVRKWPSWMNWLHGGPGEVLRGAKNSGVVFGSNIQSDIPGGGTLADRNNNPGNIRPVGGKGFRTYGTPLEGWSAMRNQLMRYYTGKTTGKKLRTIDDIVSTWAPEKDKNDPKEYARTVSRWMGVSPNEIIDLNNSTIMASLMQSMARMEGYSNWNSPLAYTASSGRRQDIRVQLEILEKSGANYLAQLAGQSIPR